jgi:hypothetical protein
MPNPDTPTGREAGDDSYNYRMIDTPEKRAARIREMTNCGVPQAKAEEIDAHTLHISEMMMKVMTDELDALGKRDPEVALVVTRNVAHAVGGAMQDTADQIQMMALAAQGLHIIRVGSPEDIDKLLRDLFGER